jgi:DNA-binding transcriptional MerR regulator
MKRRGNRRYYQHHEVLMIRKIRGLLYDQGFTISGARNKLHEIVQTNGARQRDGNGLLEGIEVGSGDDSVSGDFADSSDFPGGEPVNGLAGRATPLNDISLAQQRLQLVRRELFEIRELLSSKN